MGNIQNSIDRYYDSIMKDINSSARIVTGDTEETTYITSIIDWHDNHISFHAPLVLGDYIRLLTGRTYSFLIVTKACIYMTSVEIVKFTKNKQGHYYYKATIVSPLKRNQQRKYFRLEWVNSFKYKTNKSDEWKTATTLDISVGGLLAASKNPINKNDSIHINITLLDQDFVINGVVLESLGKNHTDLYISRIQFHELSDFRSDLLSKAIMQRQRDMLK